MATNQLHLDPAPAPHLYCYLEAVARAAPGKPAVVARDQSISYGELLERIAAFSSELQEAGVRPGDRVAVILPNGIEFIVAAFSVWKAGAVLVPLHVLFQQDELLKYIHDCNVRAVVATLRTGDIVGPGLRANRGSVEHIWLCPSEGTDWQYSRMGPIGEGSADSEGPRAELGADAPALTQYSTGSTGLPKRVTRTHGQLIGEFQAVSGVMGITDEDRILGVVPFFHCYGIMNAVSCSMLSGATLYAVSDFFPKDVAQLIDAEKITGFPGVPFMYQMLADLREKPLFESLRYLLSAGAPLPEATQRAFEERYGIGIRQLYGATEAGVVSIEAPGRPVSAPPTAGVAIPGVSVRVVDDAKKPVPAGVEGHVEIVSDYAASGYDGTAPRSDSYFLGGRFYPGDRAKIDAASNLVICGRERGFINVGGNKVDPAEVEGVLEEFPAVSDAVVVPSPDSAGDERVKAIVVTSEPCTRVELLAHCANRLADFKRPRIIEFRKELPRSPLGKVLRKYLIQEAGNDGPPLRFDPRTGFRVAPIDETGELTAVDFSTLPPFLRVLLVTDGTITKNLEAYFFEPIDVELLFHASMRSPDAYPHIGVEPGDPVILRRILLRGRITSYAYAYAESIVASEGFSDELARELADKQKGIGELLRRKQVETFRELISVRRGEAGEWAAQLGVETSAAVTVRKYTIRHGGRAAVQISEIFPDVYYEAVA